jgi:hypothetical protein
MSVYLGKDSVNVAMFARMQNEGEYTTRTTAGGEEILDGKLASVKKIQGDTVKSKNIFNRYYGTRTGGSYITETTDEKIIVRQQHDGRTYVSANIPIENPEQYIGKTLYMSAKWTCSGTNKGAIRVMWLNESMGIAGGQVNESWTSGAVVSGIVPERPANATGLYLMLYSNVDGTAVQGDTVTYTDLMISTENVPYTPYFSGLKHAYFDSIKSTGRNLVNFDEIAQNVVKKSTNSEIVTFDGKRCLKFLDIGNASIPTILPSGIIHGLRFKVYVDGEWFTSFASYKLSNGTTQYTGIIESEGKQWVEFSRYFNDDRTIESFTFYAYNYHNNAPVYIDLDSVMFEQSGTPTAYEPYKESIYKLPVPVELPAFDCILPQKGIIERATKTLVFDGTENWIYVEGSRLELHIADMHKSYKCICNYYDNIYDRLSNGCFFSVGFFVLGAGVIANFASLEEWKSYLAELYANGRPLVVSYELETPTTETIDAPETYTAWNGGVETIEQGETDNSVYGAMPTITATYLKEYFNGGIQ